jgi:plastocyanin
VPSRTLAALAVLALGCAAPGLAEEKKKTKKPGLELRSSPRFAFSPASVLFTAELKGGDDVEELYCPEVEWEWDDGGKSVTEADCDPWTDGSAIERRFTASHVFQRAGIYRVKVTLRKSGKSIMSQSLALTIRAGLGDTSPDPG